MENKEVILLSTGAIGDLVIASAVRAALWEKKINDVGIVSSNHTLGLWFDEQRAYAYEGQSIPFLPANTIVVDIRSYLRHFPHSSVLPGTDKKAHLCQWMAQEAIAVCEELEGILDPKYVSRDDVEIILSKEEVMWGIGEIGKIRREHGKLVTILAPYSNTQNRNMGMQRLEQVVRGLEDTTTICQLEPFEEAQYVQGTRRMGNKDLRKVAALLLAADAYIGVDSGPLHLLNGAIQRSEFYEHELEQRRDPAKVFVVLGSSAAEVVAYKGNSVITSPVSICSVAPCGSHGYVAPEAYGEHFGRVFHRAKQPEKDKSGCIFEEHHYPNTAPCMTAVAYEQIIEAVREYLRQNK